MEWTSGHRLLFTPNIWNGFEDTLYLLRRHGMDFMTPCIYSENTRMGVGGAKLQGTVRLRVMSECVYILYIYIVYMHTKDIIRKLINSYMIRKDQVAFFRSNVQKKSLLKQNLNKSFGTTVDDDDNNDKDANNNLKIIIIIIIIIGLFVGVQSKCYFFSSFVYF